MTSPMRPEVNVVSAGSPSYLHNDLFGPLPHVAGIFLQAGVPSCITIGALHQETATGETHANSRGM